MRRPSPRVVIGGTPIRVLRLTPTGAAMLDEWGAGNPVTHSQGAQALAGRLIDAGIAHPRPDPDGAGLATGDVTVVIPVLDSLDGLVETLAALEAPRLAGVVVVDDGSVPPVTAAGLGAGISVIRRGRTGGPATARNDGWKTCRSEVVVFLDANCLPSPGWLETLLSHFADAAVAAVAPRVVSRPATGTPTILATYEQRRSPLDLGSHEAPVQPGGRVPYVPTAALAVRVEALRAVGGFDEGMRFGEDVDLVWRLRQAGWRVRYEPKATVSHPARSGYRAWWVQRYQYGRSAADLAVRHGRDVAPLAASPWSCAAWALLWAGSPVGAAVVSLASGMALARRAGRDRSTALALASLVLRGNLGAGRSLADAVRRAWLPLLALAVLASRGRLSPLRRRLIAAAAAALVIDPAIEWGSEGPRPPLAAWMALRVADDLAYQSGLWRGVWARRSLGAVLPRW